MVSVPRRRAARERSPTGMSSGERWLRLVLLVALLYGFLVAIDVLGSGIAGLGDEFVDQLFEGIDRPIVGLLVGILATVLAQSSSVTTPTIVTLVGAGVIDLQQAVPIVMGANIGTTITNTLASLGSIRRAEEFRRAFSGATVHDVFNLLSVAVLLPLELATGLLSRAAVAVSGLVGDTTTGEFRSPAKAAVEGVTETVVAGVEALVGPGRVSGIVLLLVGLALIFACLFSITRNMKLVMAGAAERTLNRILGRSGALGILLGALLTVSVQSSSIATSLLIPMIAAGVLTLENAYPLTLGANIGTTITALIAALAVERIEGLQVALVHLMFNIAGVLMLYPVPWLRRVPLRLARLIGEHAVRRRSTVFLYIVIVFYVVPLLGIVLLR